MERGLFGGHLGAMAIVRKVRFHMLVVRSSGNAACRTKFGSDDADPRMARSLERCMAKTCHEREAIALTSWPGIA